VQDVPYRVEKPWGHELIWARTDRYVGKVLHVKAGHTLSLQYHNEKDETMHVLTGELILRIGTVDKESGANPRLEMARREAVAVEIKQPLSRTTPGEAVGEAMHQAVVEGEHERRVDRVRRLDRCGVRCPDIPCLHSRHGWTV